MSAEHLPGRNGPHPTGALLRLPGAHSGRPPLTDGRGSRPSTSRRPRWNTDAQVRAGSLPGGVCPHPREGHTPHLSEHPADAPGTAAQLPTPTKQTALFKTLTSLRLGVAAIPVSFRLGTTSQATGPLSPRGLEPRKAETRVIAPEEANLQLLLPWLDWLSLPNCPLPQGSVYTPVSCPPIPSLISLSHRAACCEGWFSPGGSSTFPAPGKLAHSWAPSHSR